MNWKIIFNPFEKIADKTLVIIGIIAFLIASVYSWINQIIFDGMMDIHLAEGLANLDYFNAHAITLVVTVFLFFLAAQIINKKTRIADIFATALIFRIPLYIAALFINTPIMAELAYKVESLQGGLDQLNFTTIELVQLLAISFLNLILLLWAVVLLFFGFKTATHAKTPLHYVVFIITIIVTEIVTKLLINLIL